jgi:hypothetical protein
VVIEAMGEGIPVVVTRRTTLEDQAREFGASVGCDDNSVESLVNAISEAEKNFSTLHEQALQRKSLAQAHFSVRHFREMIAA